MSSSKKQIYSHKFLLILAFLLPFFIMTIIYIAMGVYPFGKETLLTIDLGQQYVDFLSYYRHTLLHEPQALFYSFSKGIGGEMTGLWSYYLNSPFNLIMLLFPQRFLPVGVTVLLLIKIALSGLSFAYLLIKKFEGKDLLVPIFSLSYALMGFIIVNQLHIMWLDSLIFLPLIILGLEKIIDGESGVFYSLILGLALFSQYYLTYMICLFLIFYFVFAIVKQTHTKFFTRSQTIRFYINRFLKFTGYSLLAGGLAAFSLLPNFVSLLGGKASHTSEILDWGLKYPFLEVLSKFYIGSFNFDQMPSGHPNLFVGTVAIISFLYYLVNKKFSWKERLTATLLTIFFFFSMNVDFLNKVWHAFQNPAWYPYRFSFLVCFFFILNGFRSLNKTLHFPLWFAITLLFLQTASALYVLKKDFSFLTPLQVLATVLLLVFVLVLFLLRETEYNWLPGLLLLVTIVEMSANAAIDLTRLSYVDMAPFNDYQSVLNTMLADIRPPEDDFYRIEKVFQRSKNDSFQAHYPSASHFSSTFETETPGLFGRLGFPDSSFVISYSSGTLFTDAFFGIRYMIENKPLPETIQNTEHFYDLRANANRPDLTHYQLMSEAFRTKTYQNPYALSLGFTAPEKILSTNLENSRPIENQEKILEALSVSSVFQPFYAEVPINTLITTNIRSSQSSDLNRTYTKKDTNEDASLEIQLTTKSKDPYYLVLDSKIDKDVADLKLDGQPLNYYKTYRNDQVINLASGVNDQHIQFTFDFKKESLTIHDLRVYQFDQKEFERVVAETKSNQLDIDSFSQTKIEGSVMADATKPVLMFTIPYSNGWKVKVDDKEVDTLEVLDSLLAVNIDPGYHSIKLQYQTPYLWQGTLISLTSLGIVFIISRKKGAGKKLSL
ncbi:hypothetical protein BW727_100598 [Jeotgalibaca dankookensis]|uniref:Bacterial membrane protein YfhO n=1 Tax=Jeotgalibaca dankookensis TaxID=708126 RepID=A0A1S6INA3_9LACT|nr:YfhO family protein [Jeotgalibaca dankookensis]AQS52991.1 hypothetical protein BW727_100598 [Jeotgalibaca dankookensis]